jgi:hypothetical protein
MTSERWGPLREKGLGVPMRKSRFTEEQLIKVLQELARGVKMTETRAPTWRHGADPASLAPEVGRDPGKLGAAAQGPSRTKIGSSSGSWPTKRCNLQAVKVRRCNAKRFHIR